MAATGALAARVLLGLAALQLLQQLVEPGGHRPAHGTHPAPGPLRDAAGCIESAPMRTFEELETLWAEVPAPPRGRGTLRLVCRRVEPGVHETPEEAELSVEAGLVGDRWSPAKDPDRAAQVTLMNATVAELVAAGRQPLHEAGDNLLVDFDIGYDNLPPGSRVRIGRGPAGGDGGGAHRLQQVQRALRPGRAALGELASLAGAPAARREHA